VRRLGYALLAAATVTMFLRSPLAPAAALGLALAAAFLLDRQALRGVMRVGLLLAVVFAAAVTAGVAAWTAGPAHGLQVGSSLLLRLLVLALGAAVVARAVDAEALLAVARRLGLERFGLILGLALNTLPHLVAAIHDVWIALEVRHRGWRAVWAGPRLAELLLAHAARIAEEAAAAACLRGHSALVRSPLAIHAVVRAVVVTGPRGSGKTSAMTAAAECLRQTGVPVFGFVQPGSWTGGERTGFDLLDLASGERAALARRAGVEPGEHGTGFRFDPAGLALGRRALAGVCAGSVLLLDELGPLELRGRGHMPGVRRALATPGLEGAVLAVRRSLIPELLAALELADAVVVEVNEHPDPVGAILKALAG
jgi:nucleoside-triphosphatase THEP1